MPPESWCGRAERKPLSPTSSRSSWACRRAAASFFLRISMGNKTLSKTFRHGIKLGV